MEEGNYSFCVIWGQFPFLERPGRKKFRPLLCLSEKPIGRYNLLTVAFISSSVKEKLWSDVFLSPGDEGFEETGLKSASCIRLHKLGSVQMAKMEGTVGKLPARVQRVVATKLKKLLGL